MDLVRNIKLKMDMENYLLQHKIVALKIGMEVIDPTKSSKKHTCELHMYFLSLVQRKKKKKKEKD